MIEKINLLKEQGYEFKNFYNHYYLNFDTRKLKECINVYKKFGLENIRLSFLSHFDEKDLSCLNNLKIQRLNLSMLNLENYKEILNHPELKVLDFDCQLHHEFDLSLLPNLEELILECLPHFRNLSSLKNLKKLAIFKYKPKEKDFTEISNSEHLEQLMTSQSNFQQFDGLYALKKLWKLEIAYCPKLTNSNYSGQVLDSLLYLEIQSCKNLSLENLPVMPLLRHFRLINNGKVSTLKPLLKKMPNLEVFIFDDTEVLEEDLSYITEFKKLHKISFWNKKHYKYKEADLKAMLSSRKVSP